MFIELTCARCGQALRASRRDAGKQGRCPSCKATFAVPESGPSELEDATCHFCGAMLTAAGRRRLAESLDALDPQGPPAPPSFPDHPEMARLFPADRYGVYAMCDACRESAAQNEEEMREEREAMERQHRGCLLAAAVVAAALLAAAVVFLLRGSARPRLHREAPAPYAIGVFGRIARHSGAAAGGCPRTFIRIE